MNESGEIVGMVDVLKLTYATLEQINTMGSGDGEGPAWNKFWLSMDQETESMVSGDGSHHHTAMSSRMMSPEINRDRIGDSVAPGDSASHVGVDSPTHSVTPDIPEVAPAEVPFPFKFKAPSGRVHRIQVTASLGMEAFVTSVAAKLGNEAEAIGGKPVVEEGKMDGPGFALSYMDDEGDSVSITTDNDLLEAILLARHGHREKVDLFVHDPESPAVTVAAPMPLPPLDISAIATPPASSIAGLRERRKAYEDEDEEDEDTAEEDASAVRRGNRRTRHAPVQEQVVAGVPNELLLPGAIVTLAVVIIGVFTITRASSR